MPLMYLDLSAGLTQNDLHGLVDAVAPIEAQLTIGPDGGGQLRLGEEGDSLFVRTSLVTLLAVRYRGQLHGRPDEAAV